MSRREFTSRDDLNERDSKAVERELGVFLAITEDVLTSDFKRLGLRYRCPTIVLSDKTTTSKSGVSVSEVGPTYFFREHTIYIEPTFYFDQIRRLMPDIRKATLAYNVFHEVGHHVQNLRDGDPIETTKRLGVPMGLVVIALELQADCIAGMLANIAHRVRPLFDKGDKENIMTSAESLGDDMVAMKLHGTFDPLLMTHGTGAMRRTAVSLGLGLVTLKQVPPVEWFVKYALQATKTEPADWRRWQDVSPR